MRFRRFRSARRAQPNPEAWHPRQRDILGRLVRGTEAPTDTLPVIVNPERTQLSEYYDARLGEVLELAVSIGSVLMSSGMSAATPSSRSRRSLPHTGSRTAMST